MAAELIEPVNARAAMAKPSPLRNQNVRLRFFHNLRTEHACVTQS